MRHCSGRQERCVVKQSNKSNPRLQCIPPQVESVNVHDDSEQNRSSTGCRYRRRAFTTATPGRACPTPRGDPLALGKKLLKVAQDEEEFKPYSVTAGHLLWAPAELRVTRPAVSTRRYLIWLPYHLVADPRGQRLTSDRRRADLNLRLRRLAIAER